MTDPVAIQPGDRDGDSSRGYRWVLLGGVWLLYFAFGMTVAAMAPLVQPIRAELGLSDAAMGSILGAWPLVYIVSAMPCGAFLDRAGPRWALFAAALIIALSGVMRAVADGYVSMFVAVALFGIGGPLISIGAPKLVSESSGLSRVMSALARVASQSARPNQRNAFPSLVSGLEATVAPAPRSSKPSPLRSPAAVTPAPS